ncbi:hypothetical protein A2791_02345 [Candidatus Saccharibacteria bacterium RIFCSPHIGHO2_01_FULL_46_30]|nr:MAG: hypothetical protein A2791_02345 [Candidatus Saccharibacteria bacterium RIFCSPHIGHO2_01_FULL_46_30]
MTKNTEISAVLAQRAAQVQRGGARAAVLGVNDGLVSTLCLVVGVGAAGADPKAVLTAGFAGLLAGAISMAAGEWISVKTQVELFQGVLDDLRLAVKKDYHLLQEKLVDDFKEHGMHPDTALSATKDIAANQDEFMSMYSSQIIGINQDELGSPWRAAGSSFVLFTIGALVPLGPWMFGFNDLTAILVAIGLTALAGLFVGGYTARSSGRSVWYGSLRQLLIIVLSAGVTYGIGHIFGVVTA